MMRYIYICYNNRRYFYLNDFDIWTISPIKFDIEILQFYIELNEIDLLLHNIPELDQ